MHELFSPGKDTRVVVEVKGGIPFYSLWWRKTPILEPSALSLVFARARSFEGGFVVRETRRASHSETWCPVWDQQADYRNDYNELTLVLEQQETSRILELIFRAFDDGIGFRYRIPEQAAFEKVRIKSEGTEFNFSGDFTAWGVPANIESGLEGPLPLSRITAINTPFLLKVNSDCWVGVHEAALRNYSSMELRHVRLGHHHMRAELAGAVAAGGSPAQTPWRVMMLGAAPGKLIESGLILNLNEPCAMADTSWIKPGIAMWDFRLRGAKVDGFTYGCDKASLLRQIDFAASNGLAYVAVDAGWSDHTPSIPLVPKPEVDVPFLVDYARRKGVGFWAYVDHSILRDYPLDQTLAICKDLGFVGIKHGFLCDTSQKGVDFCQTVLEKCAGLKLMYNCHEPVKPSGLRRTYPHFMTREYVHSLVDGRMEHDPTYHVTLPFVNMLAGPLDHTPGMFDLDAAMGRSFVRNEIQSTVTAQAARCLVIFTGILNLPDHGEAYNRKKDLFEFIRVLPMRWDETRILGGEVGRFITVARRRGRSWFVASMGNHRKNEVIIPLSFLDKGHYEVTLYEDAKDAHYVTRREAYNVRRCRMTAGDTIVGTMMPGGGHCVWIRPA